MNSEDARRVLGEHAAARDAWLAQTVADLASTAKAVWQVGSFATGTADDWSDLDLILVGAKPPLESAALIARVPGNGLADGDYVGAAYPVGPLLLGVDWYVWPADIPVPVEARLLIGNGARGELDLSSSLDRHGRGVPDGLPVDPRVSTLAMLPIVAKYVGRGAEDKAGAMIGWLGGDSGADPVTQLRELLAATGDHHVLTPRISRLIDVADALRRTR